MRADCGPGCHAAFVIDPDGNPTDYDYDSLHRVIRSTDALGNVTSYSYDADSELVGKTDGNGQVINYAYDSFGNEVSEAWQGTGEVINTTYNADGQVTSVTDAASALAYTYDGQGRVLTVDNAGTPSAPDVVLTYGPRNSRHTTRKAFSNRHFESL